MNLEILFKEFVNFKLNYLSLNILEKLLIFLVLYIKKFSLIWIFYLMSEPSKI